MTTVTTTHERVIDINEAYANPEGWTPIRSRGKTNPDMPDPPVAKRTPGKAELRGKNHFRGGEGCHLIQTAEIAPGNRKYLHRHHYAETIWVVLEGEGEFYPNPDEVVPFKAPVILHCYPWQWHGMGNTGSVPIRYISIEGPQTGRPEAAEFAE
jgi:mannose-6-phosphate isomerase-like protein (cupin superfamily)